MTCKIQKEMTSQGYVLVGFLAHAMSTLLYYVPECCLKVVWAALIDTLVENSNFWGMVREDNKLHKKFSCHEHGIYLSYVLVFSLYSILVPLVHILSLLMLFCDNPFVLFFHSIHKNIHNWFWGFSEELKEFLFFLFFYFLFCWIFIPTKQSLMS